MTNSDILVSSQVIIPKENFPDINYMELFMGHQGSNIKAIEEDTGANVSIRENGTDPMYAYITSTDKLCVREATTRVKQVKSFLSPEQLDLRDFFLHIWRKRFKAKYLSTFRGL